MPEKAAEINIVGQELIAGVLLLRMAQPPVNALSAKLRAGLLAALEAGLHDPAVQAVVICSDIAQFSAGADISEFGRPLAGIGLADLCNRIESFAKPVVAAINGNALGGGLELALAAHARVAEAAALVGLPEVNLGLIPGAGGTQRLPRLVGAAAALQIMLDPAPVSAAHALAIGLIDQVVETGLHAAACDAARAMVAKLGARAPLRTSDRMDGMRDAAAYQAALAAARGRLAGSHLPAPFRVIDCVEAAQLLPLEQGLAFERAAFEELLITPQAKGLRHAFFAERRAMQLPAGLPAVAPAALASLLVCGGGDAAADLISQALAAGLRMTLMEPRREVQVATLERIAARQELAVVEGRMSIEARDADWARLAMLQTVPEMAGFDLILLAPDAPALAEFGAVSVISIGALGPRAQANRLALQPALAAGLPAELSTSAGTNPQNLAKGVAFIRRLGWKPVFSGPGGSIDRLLRSALSAAVAHLESAGFARPVIAAALASYGLGVGARAALPAAPADAPVIVSACVAAMANVGARMLSQGIARSPADIDGVAILSGLFPRWHGGPMFQADQRGLLLVRADLLHRQSAAPQAFTPDPLFDDLLLAGDNFGSLNRLKL